MAFGSGARRLYLGLFIVQRLSHLGLEDPQSLVELGPGPSHICEQLSEVLVDAVKSGEL